MIYPSDFDYYLSQSKLNTNQKIVSISHSTADIPESGLNGKIRFNDIHYSNSNSNILGESVWIRYCNNSTIHGFRYLNNPNIQCTERVTWFFLVSLALLGAVYVSQLLQNKFSNNALATVVETTFFPVYEIPYPAITICNYNRVNWKRVPEAIEFYLGAASNETISKFYNLIEGLNTFEFGSFDEFDKIQGIDLSDLDHINLTELYIRVTLRCEEIFQESCWWRNKFINCCDGQRGLFVRQKSEYGICYAFNSVLNPIGRDRYKNQSNYPWRTSTFGDWSGLRVNLLLNDCTKIPSVNASLGILIMVNHPFSWPNSAYFVPAGTSTAVVIKPAYSYTTSDVKRLSPIERKCLYSDETEKLTVQSLPETLYFRSNCMSECRQQQMIKNCNCTIDFLYPTADYPKCNISNLKCMFKYNSLFNSETPPTDNQYFSNEEEGLVCDCLPECESIDYGFNVSPIQRKSVDANVADNAIVIDVHFQQSTMVKYRTDVDFDWLDLMVAFGGIAGLFLGCSLISVAEVVFYLIIGLTKLPWKKISFFNTKNKISNNW